MSLETVLGMLFVLWFLLVVLKPELQDEKVLAEVAKAFVRDWLFRPLRLGWQNLKLFWQRSILRIRPAALVQLASELDLTLERYRFSSIELVGQRGSLAAELHCWIGRSVTARIENPGIPTALLVAQRSPLGTSRVPTGDEVFDRKISVIGDEVTSLALLDQHTRSQMRELIALGGEVGDSGVKISTSGFGQSALELVQEGSKALDLAVEFSRLLTIEGPEVPGRLARNAQHDPLPAVRLKNLQALGRHFPFHPESSRQHRVSLRDTSAEVRFRAAEFLLGLPGVGPAAANEAARVLAALARTNLPEDFRARSIRRLADHNGDADFIRNIAEPLITDVLNEKTGTMLVAAAIGSLAALGLRNLIPRLEELAPTAEYPVAIAIAKALGILGGPQAQPLLLHLLGRSAPEILQEAAKALGEVGDHQAVEPLLELSRFSGKEPVSQTALEAARRIQGRLVGAEAGQLSLAAPAELEGALSAYDVAAGPGDLSMAEAAPPAPTAPRRVAEGS